jgi:hypothetical protein
MGKMVKKLLDIFHYYLPLNNIERKKLFLLMTCRHPCSLLRELRLSHCYLGRNGFNSQAFHRLPSLEILDLSENFLNTIPPAARLPTVRVCPLKKSYIISSIFAFLFANLHCL